MTFSERIQSERLRLNLTQVQAASLLGISASALGKWETGVKTPKALTQEGALARLAKHVPGPIQTPAVRSITDRFTGFKPPGEFGLCDDMDGDVECPICGAEIGQQCSEKDPSHKGMAIELGKYVHIQRIQLEPQK